MVTAEQIEQETYARLAREYYTVKSITCPCCHMDKTPSDMALTYCKDCDRLQRCLPQYVVQLLSRTHDNLLNDLGGTYELLVYSTTVEATVKGPAWNPTVTVSSKEMREDVGIDLSYTATYEPTESVVMRGMAHYALELVDPMNERGEDD